MFAFVNTLQSVGFALSDFKEEFDYCFPKDATYDIDPKSLFKEINIHNYHKMLNWLSSSLFKPFTASPLPKGQNLLNFIANENLAEQIDQPF